jgi:hypothetical protein
MSQPAEQPAEQPATLPTPTWPVPSSAQCKWGRTLAFKLYDHEGEMTVRPAWRYLLFNFLLALPFSIMLAASFWPMFAVRPFSIAAWSVIGLVTIVLWLFASIPFFTITLNFTPILELRAADSLLRWHRGIHSLPLSDVEAFEVFEGNFWRDSPAGLGSTSDSYTQWRVRSTTGDTHVIWHTRGKSRTNFAVLQEFVLAAGLRLEQFEAHLHEDQSKPEGRQIRLKRSHRVS